MLAQHQGVCLTPEFSGHETDLGPMKLHPLEAGFERSRKGDKSMPEKSDDEVAKRC